MKKTERLSRYAPLTENKGKQLKKRTRILLRILLVGGIGWMLFTGYQAFINTAEVPRDRDVTRYQDILTEEEQAEWHSRKVQTGEAVFQLNLVIPVVAETSRAEIRLVHPPYSDFICQVILREVESGLVLYESEEMIPGTLIQYVTLSEVLAIGDYGAIVEHKFIDGKGKVQGSYEVEVVLEVREEGKSGSIVNPYDDLMESLPHANEE